MKKIFISYSYSHEDADFMNMLEKQLKVLELEGICNLWVDKQIQRHRLAPGHSVNSRTVIDGYELQCLDYLSPNECKALFYQFYTGQKDDETAAKIVDLIGFHTLTVELLAKTAHHAAMSIAAFYGVLKAKGCLGGRVFRGQAN